MKNVLKQKESFVDINLPHHIYEMMTTENFLKWSVSKHGNWASVVFKRVITMFEKNDYSFLEEVDYSYLRKEFMEFKRKS